MERKYWLALAISTAGVVIAGGSICSFVLVDTPEGWGEVPPTASFDYTHDASNETLAVTQTGGSEFSPDTTRRLEVHVTESGTPNVTESQPNRTVSLPFRIGETFTVSNVGRGDIVYLVWWEDGKSSGEKAIVAKHTVGENETR